MSEEQLARIETRLDGLQADVAGLRRETHEMFREMSVQIDSRFTDAASQARREYDAISHTIGEVQTAAAERDESLRREMTEGFSAIRQELAESAAGIRQDLRHELAESATAIRQDLRQELAESAAAIRQDVRQELAESAATLRRELASGLQSCQSDATGVRRVADRIEDKLDRVLAARSKPTPGRRRR